MRSIFFMGLNPRWQQYRWLPGDLNVMYSAAGFWAGSAWRRRHFINKGLKWLDSGGYSLLNRVGSYPFSVSNYMNLVAFLSPDFYASMDYPCEPTISRRLGLMTNAERIQATVSNAVEINQLASHVAARLVPVIQGYTLDEYKYCVDLYAQAGLIREYMAVGSMCRRISTEELNRLIPSISRYAAAAGANKLHFFGLKLDPRLGDLSEFIYSRDSAVVLDSYEPGARAARGGRRYPKGQAEKAIAFAGFTERLDRLGMQWRKGSRQN